VHGRAVPWLECVVCGTCTVSSQLTRVPVGIWQEYINSRERQSSGGAEQLGLPTPRTSKTVVKDQRRRAEVFGGDDDGEYSLSEMGEREEPKKIPKSKHVMALLKKSLLGNAMFSDLDDHQIHEICECMEGVLYKPGDCVFRLDHPGDFFYVVEQGTCDVFLTAAEDVAVQSVTDGGSFGELALLYNDPRAATVKAKTEARLWRVHGNTFKAVVIETTYKKRKYFETLLDKVPLLNALKQGERAKIADALEEVTFPSGYVIMRQNDHGDFFYFCQEGTAKVTKKDRHGADTEVMSIGDGDYFGELALLTDHPRRATITTTSLMKCARMHRRDFNRLLGPLHDILTFRKYNEADDLMGTPMYQSVGSSGGRSARDTRRQSIVDSMTVEMPAKLINSLAEHEEEHTARGIEADLAIMSPKAPEFPEGTVLTLQDFDMGVTLGLGSFGRVRLGRYKKNGKFYAIKIMNKAAVLQMKQLEHIRSEKHILLQVAYPFVVNLYGTFQDETNLYMVFEFVCGGEFFTLLRNEDKLPNDQTRFYATEIVLTLSFLHNLSIVYRDLKPENLLIDKDGHLKITDFGFAKEVEDRTWTLCGTPDYIAPEIIRNKGHNKGADWWAFGVLLFEMLAGYPPFYDESGGFGTYKKILKGVVEYPDHCTADAVDLMSKLLVADLTKVKPIHLPDYCRLANY
jgi:CRP-like cAMP-binding protein